MSPASVFRPLARKLAARRAHASVRSGILIRDGKIRAELEKKGTPLTEPHMRIASIALCHKLVLVTGNVKHFSKISGLTIENWIKT